MVQSLDRSQGRAGAAAAPAASAPGAPATFTGNRALQIEEPLIFEMGQPGRCGLELSTQVTATLQGLDDGLDIGRAACGRGRRGLGAHEIALVAR